MNKIYKLIWSKVRNDWVVASEIAKGHGKSSSSEGNGKRLKSLVLMALLGCFVMTADGALASSHNDDYNLTLGDDSKAGMFSTAIGPNADAGGACSTALGESSKAQKDNSTALGRGAEAQAEDSTAVGTEANAQGNASTALGRKANAVKVNATAVGQGAQAKEDSSTAVGQGAQAEGKLSTALGQGAEAKGESSTAVGKEAKAEKDNATALGQGAQAKEQDSTALGYGAIADELSSTALGSEAHAKGISSTALGEEAIAEALCSTAVGKGAHANGESSTAVGYEAKALVDGGVALGSGSIASINKGIVGYDPSTGEASTETSAIWKATQAAFSVGSAKDKNNLITRQITNVAAGTQDTDAVNVAQLKALATAPMNFYFGGTKDKGTDAYTPGTKNWSMSLNEFRMDYGDGLKAEQVTDKDNKTYTLVTLDVEKVENIAKGKTTELKTEITKEMHEFKNEITKEMNEVKTESVRGDALGAALSALKPLDYDPYNRSQIMAGVSTYKGREAVALGLAHYSNENTLVHAGLSYAGSSELMANVGVSYRFGSKDDKEAQKARNLRMPQYDKGPISSVYILEDKVERLTKANKEANDRIAALEAKLEKVLEKVK